MKKFNSKELEQLVIGSAFLASGGGGPLLWGLEVVKVIEQPIKFVEIEEVDAEQWGAVPAGIGARKNPLSERASRISLEETIKILLRTFALLETAVGKKFSYILPLEIGVVNILAAMLVAVERNMPMINGDGTGRSAPDLDMTRYAATGISVSPWTMANLPSTTDEQMEMVLYAQTPSLMDQLAKSIISKNEFFTSEALIATFAMSGKTLQEKKPVIPGTITLACEVGAILHQAKEKGKDPIKAILKFFNDPCRCKDKCAFLLFQGIISEIQTEYVGGNEGGYLKLKQGDEEVRVDYLNENLIAWSTDKSRILAMAPDPICYLTPDGQPLTNTDALHEGDELALIGLKALEGLREDSIIQAYLKVLRTWGYDGPYVPIEELQP